MTLVHTFVEPRATVRAECGIRTTPCNSGLSQNPTALPKVYKVPRLIQFVADLPKTSTGKIMRRELRKLDT